MSEALSRRDFLARWLRPADAIRQPTPTMKRNPPEASAPPTDRPDATATSSPAPLRLPALQQTVLDIATTDALFRDLAACTQIHAVIPKYVRSAHTGPGSLTLEQARTRLAAGLLLGVQIRYGYEGHTWCDTLMQRPAGLTLVRIREADIVATLERTPSPHL
jgi:hypothetical protein